MVVVACPSFLGTLSSLLGRITARSAAPVALVRGFDPERETLTLTLDDVRAGDEVIFRDCEDGCRVELRGSLIALIADVAADRVDADSVRFVAA